MVDPKNPPPTAMMAPWDRGGSPQGFTLHEAARRAGHLRWIEMRLFEALGRWVATVPEVEAKLLLGAHSFHHAWHADLWLERIPVLRDVDPEALTVPPNDELVAFVDALIEPQAPELTIEKLAGVYRVLVPAKVAAYRFHLANTSPITDAPTIRALGHILQDELADWQDGEALLQALVTDEDHVGRAIEHQARLQRLLVAAGGVAGPGTLGDR